MKFDKRTINFLKKMGWSENRIFDSSSYFKLLVEDGYSIFPAAKKFLNIFGGLTGTMPAHHDNGKLESIHFNSELAIENIYREKIVIYERRCGEALVVVGEAHNSHLTLLLSDSGRLFGGYDDYLCLLGDSIEQGIIALFESKNAIEIN